MTSRSSMVADNVTGEVGSSEPNAATITMLDVIAPIAFTSFAGTVSAATRTATFTETADYMLCKVGSVLIADGDTRIVVALLGSDQVTVDADTTWGAATPITSLQDPISQHKDSACNVDMYVNAFGGIGLLGGTGLQNGIVFGDGDTGLRESVDDSIVIVTDGSAQWLVEKFGDLRGSDSTHSAIRNVTASATIPVLLPRYADSNTGVGWAATDQLSLIAGGVEGMRFVENGGIIQLSQVTSGITANVGSSQGDGALLSSFNEISVCANPGNAVTLPSAVAGYRVTIINNGANAADVFPASGDDCGGGVDAAASLAAGANITYFAYDATNWVSI